MSLFPNFNAIRHDLLQLFADIERDLGLETFPNTIAGSQQQQGLLTGQTAATTGQQQQQQQQGSQIVKTGGDEQLATAIDFNKPLAANFKITDEGDKFVATGEFPGVRPEDLHVSVKNGMLTLDASRNAARERRSGGARDQYQSYSYSSSSERVARTIPLPNGVDESRVETNFNNGQLRLVLGKSQQAMHAEKQQQQQVGQQAGQQTAQQPMRT